jgi:predicted transcriptional regulator YdeE
VARIFVDPSDVQGSLEVLWRVALHRRPQDPLPHGVAQENPESSTKGERLTLEAGEYAVVQVNDTAMLRDTWRWLLEEWLPASGRREKHAPEFERYTDVSEAGTPIGPVEIWIPLEFRASS